MKLWDELKAEDVMSAPVITLDAEDLLRDAARTLSEYKISGALVMDHRGEPVGVVSLFDIASHLAGLDRPAGEPGGFYRQSYPKFGDEDDPWTEPEGADEAPQVETTVEEIMAEGIISVPPDMSLVRVAATMSEQGIHRVFVAGPGATPQGLISTMDVLRALAGQRRAKATA